MYRAGIRMGEKAAKLVTIIRQRRCSPELINRQLCQLIFFNPCISMLGSHIPCWSEWIWGFCLWFFFSSGFNPGQPSESCFFKRLFSSHTFKKSASLFFLSLSQKKQQNLLILLRSPGVLKSLKILNASPTCDPAAKYYDLLGAFSLIFTSSLHLPPSSHAQFYHGISSPPVLHPINCSFLCRQSLQYIFLNSFHAFVSITILRRKPDGSLELPTMS